MLGIMAILIMGYVLMCIADSMYYVMCDITSVFNKFNLMLLFLIKRF